MANSGRTQREGVLNDRRVSYRRALRRSLPAALVATGLTAILALMPPRVRADGTTLKIYVAASTRAAVDAVVRQFESDSGVHVEVSPGSSSKLAKQIVEGAPADLFLSADQANVDYLASKQLVVKRQTLLGNRLVVVTPADASIPLGSLADLAEPAVRQVAVALEKVPAGEYARQALRRAGVWKVVEPKVVGGDDVTATLAFVERGAAAGVVYLTDTIGNSKVRLAFEIDPTLHAPIEYPLALIRREPSAPEATRLYEYLLSATAAAIFRKAQFQSGR